MTHSNPTVDVIIPVHTDQRPIARAVGSVLEGTSSSVRVIVVCHGIAAGAISAALGTWASDPRVTLLEFADGVPSPAGPVNAGLDAATADFTALLDSDDMLELGAIDSWLALQGETDADVVIPRQTRMDGSPTRTPPVRLFRTRDLDPVLDRLLYRTRQAGLVRRAMFGTVRMAQGLRSGEDVQQGLAIWFSGANIVFARNAAGYVIGDESDDRTSMSPKPAHESLLFLEPVLSSELVRRLTAVQRESLAVKLLRTHILDVATVSAKSSNRQDIADLAAASERILELSPDALRYLSRTEARAIRALRAKAEPDQLWRLLNQRYEFWRPSNLLPDSLFHIIHREAPLRLLAASAFVN